MVLATALLLQFGVGGVIFVAIGCLTIVMKKPFFNFYIVALYLTIVTFYIKSTIN